eukprot:3673035-Prymnesium_polylepis.1
MVGSWSSPCSAARVRETCTAQFLGGRNGKCADRGPAGVVGYTGSLGRHTSAETAETAAPL